MSAHIYHHKQALILESGQVLPELEIAYHTYGVLNEKRDNVVWVCHALTGNSDVADWWSELVGPGKLLDPNQYFIVCANMPGSCYGSTYALSKIPGTEEKYYYSFPILTNKDIVAGFEILRKHLEVNHIYMITGGSMGGQQAIEWAVSHPSIFSFLIPMATNAKHSPWGVAFNEAQRMSIKADQSWGDKDDRAGIQGMMAARATAMLSYRSYEIYNQKQQDSDEVWNNFRASSYQKYQGEKLSQRFDAFAYWTLSKAMDSHNVGRNRGGIEKALGQIQAQTLVIGIDSDLLFPVQEQIILAEHIPGAIFQSIQSIYGHDGFLVETQTLRDIIRDYMKVMS